MDRTDWITLTKKQETYLLGNFQELVTQAMANDQVAEDNHKARDIPL